MFSFSFAKASILFVKKCKNDLRLCVDYKKLNIIMIKNRYLISLVNQLLNWFSEATPRNDLRFKPNRSIRFLFSVWNRIESIVKKPNRWQSIRFDFKSFAIDRNRQSILLSQNKKMHDIFFFISRSKIFVIRIITLIKSNQCINVDT